MNASKQQNARETLRNYGVPLGRDFHTLPSSIVDAIAEAARTCGYRKPRNANGSRARYFYAYANRGH